MPSMSRTRSSRSRAAGAGDAQRDADVLGRGQHRDEAERLEDERDGAAAQQHPLALAHRGDVAPGDVHAAAGRAVQAADDVEQRGLARAGPPAQRDQLARADRERDAAQRVHGRAAAAEGAGHVAGGDHRPAVGGPRGLPGRRRWPSPSRPPRRCLAAAAGWLPGCLVPDGPDRPARRRCDRARPPAGPGPACRAARPCRGAAAPARPGPAPRTRPRAASRCRSSSAAACRSVSLLVRPSRIATVRRTCSGHRRVVGDDQDGDAELGVGRLQRGEHVPAVALSSSPVGSSASSTRGPLASAVAMAARCCSPPDICSGLRSAQ